MLYEIIKVKIIIFYFFICPFYILEYMEKKIETLEKENKEIRSILEDGHKSSRSPDDSQTGNYCID